MSYDFRMVPDTKTPPPGHSDVTTDGIRVRVGAQRVEHHNYPDPHKNIFVYQVRIENVGDAWARLESRYWRIIDADGEAEEVEGPGVVGKFPELEPGDSHTYQSFCPLDTHWGSMEGYFVFRREDGTSFHVVVGRFFLSG